MSFSYYGELCTEVYELTKPVGHSIGGDIEFYQQKLAACKGRILEVMVGSGRVMIPLLEAGLTVDGTDYSPEMLAVCRQHCEERGLQANLVQADLQQLSLSHQYEAIIIPCGSFLLIEDRQQSLDVLKRLYEHLQPGGRLILDLFLPDANFEVGSFAGTSTFHFPNGDLITMESKLVEADLFNQFKVSHLKYEKWRNGNLVQTELQRFAIRWYGLEEFKLVLESIGFSDVVVSADYVDGRQPSHAKQCYTFEAVRK
ncbi:class I SAM-dependent methyltransferase [Paenibacillus sp. SC116]|uniref:class I SAM-dependent methyltransferase n=1 Tax=Paenibacillus sp. SC116 TaxID=2968986 RepID=UPI00215A6813|nr:class I SAM-dependent methyltransferase [Paenibacillus sp. SC116]MCR8846419.1 class I SAM-dependent methyltransferase [Paenibacillus sp. SC116]